jgi:two-component system LytT family response regulator
MPPEQPNRVLIADDELLARQRLEDLLAHEPGVEIVEMVDSGTRAVEAIRRLAPDLVFLDVQMPGHTGVEVVKEVGPHNMPVVIFVTAYDQYALKAFDLAALDYLIKPFDDERFDQALERARRMINLREVNDIHDRLAALFQGQGATPALAERPRYLERIAVEMRGQLRVVPVDQVDFITASGPYAELQVGDDTFIIREQMHTLEDRLDPQQFFRTHRSVIVRLDRIDALLYSAGGDYAVRLKSGKRLKVSRSRRDELEERLGLDALRSGGKGE